MKNIPRHIVLFPDGNRRWAKQNGIASLEGHMKGYENLLDFSESRILFVEDQFYDKLIIWYKGYVD